MLMIQRGDIKHGAVPASTAAGKKENQTQRAGGNGAIIKSPTNVLDIEAGGDAKMLEISGQGLTAFSEHIKLLREWGLEICGGMKSDAATTKGGVESGRALEILYQALILVMKRWRVSIGNRGFIPLVRLLLTGMQDGVIEVDGVGPISPDTTMRLIWPQWMTPSGADLSATATAAQLLAGGSTTAPVPLLPRTVVTRFMAANIGITDASTIIDELEEQVAEDEKKQQAQAERDHANAVDLIKAKPAKSPIK